MPVDRTLKVKPHVCDFVGCDKSFARPFDLRRHKVLHGEVRREYQCPFETCSYSSPQSGNLNTHLNSQHKKTRVACGKAYCKKMFPDTSSRIRHRRKFHQIVEEADPEFTSSPILIPVHMPVIQHVEGNSLDKVKEIVDRFSAFTLEPPGMPIPSTDL